MNNEERNYTLPVNLLKGVGMFTFESTGSFKKTDSFLKSMFKLDINRVLNNCGQEGVSALSYAAPYDSGLVSRSWGYKISRSRSGISITWTNSDTENGFPVAVMLQYGYGTGGGGYVQGRDYINPAIKPIFDKISNTVWKVVTSA
jgi:hypothetical protein